MQSAFDRRHAQAQHLTNVVVRKSFHIRQDIDVAIDFRHLSDGVLDQLMSLPVERRLLRANGPGRMMRMSIFQEMLKRITDRMLFARRSLAPVRQGSVDRNPMQPSRKGRFSPESVQLPHHLQEDILGHILGVGVVAEHAPRQVVDPRRIIAKDLVRR